jgi:putative lipoprotein
MAMMSVGLTRVIMVLIWLTILVQFSRSQTDCGVSMVFHSPESDSLKIADKWFARDKAEHLVVSAFLSGVSCSIFRDFYNNQERSSVYFSAALTFTLGLGKEFYDRGPPQGKFSYKDLVADVLGTALGIWIATR